MNHDIYIYIWMYIFIYLRILIFRYYINCNALWIMFLFIEKAQY